MWGEVMKKHRKIGISGCLFALFILAVLFAVSIVVTGGLVWLVCWGLEITFTWKLVIGVWALLLLVGGAFNIKVNTND